MWRCAACLGSAGFGGFYHGYLSRWCGGLWYVLLCWLWGLEVHCSAGFGDFYGEFFGSLWWVVCFGSVCRVDFFGVLFRLRRGCACLGTVGLGDLSGEDYSCGCGGFFVHSSFWWFGHYCIAGLGGFYGVLPFVHFSLRRCGAYFGAWWWAR